MHPQNAISWQVFYDILTIHSAKLDNRGRKSSKYPSHFYQFGSVVASASAACSSAAAAALTV